MTLPQPRVGAGRPCRWRHRRLLRTAFAFLCVAASTAPGAQEASTHLLDDFADLGAWQVSASDDVKAGLRGAPGSSGQALCLDFDFGAVSGYATARRTLPLDYPDNYEFSFGVRGDALVNNLQFKLVDASGENVWWVNQPDFAFPHDWQRVRLKKRHIAFAWGPAQDRMLHHSATLELVVARGQGGGKGTVCFDRLEFRTLPVVTAAPPPRLDASSTLAPSKPADALDDNLDSAWRSDPAAGPEQTLTVDFAQPREFGGLILHWLPGAHATRYTIDFSDDSLHWRTVRRVVDGRGGATPLLLPESETRYLRLRLHDGPARAYGLAEIEVKDLAWGASPNAFFQSLARAAPRGQYPRGFSGEQSYWTVLGIDGGNAQGLLSEDGALEIGPRAGSIEPFVLTTEGLVTWADVAVEQSLQDGYLPIPSVTWRHAGWTLQVTAFGNGERTRSGLLARYTLENRSDHPCTMTLVLAMRPFQVNPPTQFLNTPGGVASIHALAWDGKALRVEGQSRIFPLQRPDQVMSADFDAGSIAEVLARAQSRPEISDESGFASALLLYRVALPSHGRREIGLVAPLTGAAMLPRDHPRAWVDQQQSHAAAVWRAKLNHVALRLPAAGRPLRDTLRTALAHILISRAGAALQPGTRAYARSWVRDGTMMSDALLRLGHARVGRDYAEWFAAHQYADGKVPCCVDARGADPVVENDSQGELLHLIAAQYRYTHHRAWLEAMWPHVSAAVAYMDMLRQRQSGALPNLRGLMPASISHEGYADRPAYSYWDDFWALAGYDHAVDLAGVLGRDDEARRFAESRDQFRRDLESSLRASTVAHAIDYLPGSADRGDFDPTSTTIALSLAGLRGILPPAEMQRTFARYWEEFVFRRDGPQTWDDYTPYEWRSVGAFVRLGWRERAAQLLDYFFADRRPAAWNQWAEVVGREVRRPRFVGDMPHGWVASDFINSALDLFAYERTDDQAMVLAGGVPLQWLAGHGIAIEHLRTPYGKLGYRLRSEGQRVLLDIGGGFTPPQGGLVFVWPYAEAPGPARVNGRPLPWSDHRELRIRRLPATLVIEKIVLRGD